MARVSPARALAAISSSKVVEMPISCLDFFGSDLFVNGLGVPEGLDNGLRVPEGLVDGLFRLSLFPDGFGVDVRSMMPSNFHNFLWSVNQCCSFFIAVATLYPNTRQRM